MTNIRVLLVDDHEIVRNGIKQLLVNDNDIEVIDDASNGIEAIDKVKSLNPDVVVMDVGMPELNGVEALAEMKKQGIENKVLFLSMFDNEDYVIEAVKNGAYGYILKDADKSRFINAIKTVYQGKKYYGHEVSSYIVDQLANSDASASSLKNLAANNSFDLSERELDILSLVVDGHSNKIIAEKLDISVRTIETHRLRIMKKMKVGNVAEMVKVAIMQNLIWYK